jgi:NAD(P)-dependent dehydrogenase (short-subunit alcohol dehydrogenase family)
MTIKANGVALVTGAAKRLGRSIALKLASEGYALALHCNHSRIDAELLMAEIVSKNGRACVISGDLSDSGQVGAMVHSASSALGPVTVLINNASIFEDDRIENLNEVQFQRHMAINLQAPLMLARDFAAQLPAHQEGVIINLIDQRVFKLNPQFFSYTLSKAALLTATKTLAQALAPRIRVNGVGPGPTLANIHEGSEGFEREAQATLLKRGVSPDDIADAVLYLIKARGITGQMIAVDSGQHLVWQTPDIIVT